jgi:hypothetical protein
LPRIRAALARGELSIEAVIELCRFAGPEDDEALAAWAAASSISQVRRAAERAGATAEEAVAAHRDRFLEYGYTEQGARFWLHADLPGPDGAQVAARIEAIAAEIPVLPHEEPHPALGPDAAMGTRRADALVGLCRDRGDVGTNNVVSSAAPTVVVHTTVEDLLELERDSHIEGGPAICRETLQRFICDGRIKPQLEDRAGAVLDVGRARRQPTRALLRQVRHRDGGCAFPGCSHGRWLQAHHITWWSRGGRTDLDNLSLVCTFHHTLVHEHGWSLRREDDGWYAWFRPDGTRYRAGPAAA